MEILFDRTGYGPFYYLSFSKTDMKGKIKKQVKRTIIYTEYTDGMRSLKANLPEEIEKWIAQDYLMRLLHEK